MVLETALEKQKATSQRLGEILMEMKAVSSRALARALALQQGLDYMETISEEAYCASNLGKVPVSFLRKHLLFPMRNGENRLLVAVADPLDIQPLNDLAVLTGLPVEMVISAPEEIIGALNRNVEKQADSSQEFMEDIPENLSDSLGANLEPADLLDTSDEAPLIRFVNSLITQGYKQRASDIHIEPYESEVAIRYRVDGILYDILRPPRRVHAGLVSRIKIMSNLNIAEKRLPQDGRFRVRIAGKDVDVRVSTLPTAFGERAVLRLLDKSSSILTLEELGMGRSLLDSVEGIINKPHGILLVTGPTGSGKTTTLYAALSRLNSREKNIITVEDPIEYQLAGVGQIQVNPKIDLTFASGLRSILRQDPDIIMIGEIRDRETAEIAIQSALTGHMVFSTLHTNDSAGALTRLVEMGVEPFLAASSIIGILAQRLVRRVCPHCRKESAPPAELVRELESEGLYSDQAVFFHGDGCKECMNIGYRGRTGLYELLVVDDEVRDLLLQKKDSATIKNSALRRGMKTLRTDGLKKALKGETSLEEVLRVTQEEV
ncbi:MAG: type II secretion system ATPase GspE [Deltaproteobacteria bacterium]|nr:type II secretion system ATPase GspE [Deltaproteobacteria bacterium]